MLATMLLLWLIANFGPQVIVYLLTGKPYFALSPVPALLSELAIMTLNLALPVVAIILSRRRSSPLGRALAWRWNGWSTLAWGLLGLGLILASFPLVNRLVGSAPFAYGSVSGPLRLPQDWERHEFGTRSCRIGQTRLRPAQMPFIGNRLTSYPANCRGLLPLMLFCAS